MARILIVDDEADVRRMIRHVFERAGHEVQAAGDGVEAMEQVHATSPELVITDIMMPRQNGLTTIGALVERPFRPKIIAMTASVGGGPDDYLETARRLGADAVLRKPFRTHEVIELATDLLRQESESQTEPVAGL